MEQENTHVWHINIDLGQRKPSAEQIAAQNKKCDEIAAIAAALNAVNAILLQEGVELSQSEGDSHVGFTPPIYANGVQTYIDDKTGLFYIPSVPEKWDENTALTLHIPTFLNEPIIYHFTHTHNNDTRRF